MTAITSTKCPQWCTSIHSPSDYSEGESLLHSKEFGIFEDGTLGVLSIFAKSNPGSEVHTEVLVNVVEMVSAADLRDLAKDCLEAAVWMEQNLGSNLDLTSHGN